MNTKLTTGEKLKDLRVERHMKLEELSKEVLIATSTLSNYENDENYDISAVNIAALADYYGVSVDYLLGRTDNRTETCTEIEELHLDDEVIEILKNGKINNRLLCDLVKDSDFLKLLTDIEIYVDGIAQLQINNINSYVNVARKEIIDKYKQYQINNKLTQQQVADKVHISRTHLSRIFNGERTPAMALLNRMEEVMETGNSSKY